MKRSCTQQRSVQGRRGGVLGVALLLVAGFIVAAGLAVFVVARTVHIKGKDDNVSFEVPGGSLQIRGHKKLDVEAMGIPVYPNSVPASKDNQGGASFEWSSNDGKTDKALTIAGAGFITHDPPDRVVDFYRGRLNNWIFVRKKNGEMELEHTDGAWKRIVSIQERSDGTHIGVASVGEPAGN